VNKASLFDVDERVEMARHVLSVFPNVTVESFEGLTVHFVRKIGARIILRGLRTLSDMEYEFGMTLTNHRLDPEVETVFLMAGAEYSHVSSTLVKQVAFFGGEEELKKFVPEPLVVPILSKVARGAIAAIAE
jgi:pantetheine-phosphate adenylyltransferase